MAQVPFTFRRRPPADPALKASASKAGPEAQEARFVYSVTGIQRELRGELERVYGQIWVGGEVSSFNLHAMSGHAYFILKDAHAQLRCVIYRDELQRLRFQLKNGVEVIARGKLTVFDCHGQLQLAVDRLEPQGDGAAEEAFRRLAERLRTEGLTAPERKRGLPLFPRAVGVVTSRSGAALRDVVKAALRRDPFTRLVISAAQVQGDGAAFEIVHALQRLERLGGVDVIIVARGGGSREDLWAFNQESVARAIASTTVPVVTGIGHETDTSIADLVSDLRCSTPTAAVEAVIPLRAELRRRWVTLENRLDRAVRAAVQEQAGRLYGLERQLRDHDPIAVLRRRAQLIDELTTRAERCLRMGLGRRGQQLAMLTRRLARSEPKARIASLAARIQLHEARARRAVERGLEADRQRLAVLAGRLESLSPVAVLARGYALVRAEDGRLVRSASEVAPGEELRIRVAQGEIVATVKGDRDE